MELEELKNSWNALSKNLANHEVVNLQIVKEVIAQKTRTAYDNIYKLNLYHLIVTVMIIIFVFPFVYFNEPISTASFLIVEALLVIGTVPQVRKIVVLSEFDLETKKCNELSKLVLRYRQICYQETSWIIAVVCLAMSAFYISEIGFNKAVDYQFGTSKTLLVLGMTLLTFGLGFVIAQWQRRHHAQQMLEIERGLEELKVFEN